DAGDFIFSVANRRGDLLDHALDAVTGSEGDVFGKTHQDRLRLAAITALLRLRLGGKIDSYIENRFQRLADRFLRFPAGQFLGLTVHHDDLAVDVGSDNAVTDRAQRYRKTFFLRINLLFETFSLGHIADHRDIKPLLIDHHFTQRNFNRESDLLASAAESECAGPSAAHDLGPAADNRFYVVLAFEAFWNKAREIAADHFVIAASEHFLRRRIHGAYDAGFINRDHAVANVLDDGADVRFCAFELGKLSANQHETVTVRDNQESDGQESKQCQRRRA